MRLETARLVLRPLAERDIGAVAARIFGDPEVVRTLCHDGSTSERCRAYAAEWQGWAGEGNPSWEEGVPGIFALEGRTGAGLPEGLLGVCGTVLKPDGSGWRGEPFYALAGPARGRRLMGEAVAAVLAACDRAPGPVALFATYWPLLNPASARLLHMHGFGPAGRLAVLDDLHPGRLDDMRRFDPWRLARSGADWERVAREVGIRLGQLSLEDGQPASEVLDAREAARPAEAPASKFGAVAREAVALGRANPAFAVVTRPSRPASRTPGK